MIYEKANNPYEQESEEMTLANMYMRMAGQALSELYLKANVKDNRYLFF